MFEDISKIQDRQTRRASSWDKSGRNADSWNIPAGESIVLADIQGPGRITHLWMTQSNHYRECLLKITWDNAEHASVLCPLGDFFGLGHGMVSSYQSFLFTASTYVPYRFDQGCALNCYVPMPFRERALVELINESEEDHGQYFYIDYETDDDLPEHAGYFHSEFRRTNPFRGWGPEIASNGKGAHLANIANKEDFAWEHNYVILETRGKGHYIGCNLSVTNLRGDWWGEGDDMIWVDGYKWPPDLHGTGSEDYLNQAWGMQDNAFLRCGSSLFEGHTIEKFSTTPWHTGGYQTSYVHHLENPVRFQNEIKVSIEHGHANHLGNEMASTAYWYAETPTAATPPPQVKQRMPVLRDEKGNWLIDPENQCPGPQVPLNEEMQSMRKKWEEEFGNATGQ